METFKKILKTATFRHSVVSFAGTLGTGILGLIFYVFMARILGPAKFGIFSLSVTTIALVSSIANFGSDTSVIRFVSRDRLENEKKALGFLKLTFLLKLAVWVIVSVFGYLLMPWIIMTFFGKDELITPFRIALFGIGGTLFSSYSLATLQSYSKFGWWSIVNVGANLLRLAGVVLLGLSSMLAVENALWVYGGVLFAMFLFNLIFLMPRFFRAKITAKLRLEFFGFSKWVSVFTAISAVGSRIDTYLSARFLALTTVGNYAVGTSLVSFVTQVVLALGSVVAPKLSSMQDKQTAVTYLKKLQLFVLVLAVAGLVVGIPLGYFAIPLIYGQEYIASVLPFSILLTGQAIFLISVPVHMSVMYYFSQPKLFVYITLTRLIVTFVLGALFIPTYGVTGSAVTVLIGNFTDFIIPAIWVVKRFNR